MTFASRWLPRTLIATLLAVAALTLVEAYMSPTFGPDAWSLLELARTIGNEFYRINTWRSFFSAEPWSQAFPPLWPVLIALGDRVSQMGTYAAVVLATLCFLAFATVAELLGRRNFRHRWVGLLSALGMFAYAPLRADVLIGGVFSLQLLLLATLILVFGATDLKRLTRAVLIGALGGALVMNRFDALPVLLVTLAALWLLDRRLKSALVAGATATLVISPWIAYSMVRFVRFFVTDYALVASSIDPSLYVIDFLTTPPRVLTDDPLAWFAKLLNNVPSLVVVLVESIVSTVVVVPLLGLLVVLWWRCEPDRARAFTDRLRSREWLALLLIGVALFVGCAAFLTTGYFRTRYLAPLMWWSELVLLLAIFDLARSDAMRWRTALTAAAVMGAVALSGPLHALFATAGTRANAAELNSPSSFAPLLRCLDGRNAEPHDTVMFLDDNTSAARFGAVTGWRASMTPSNWSQLSAADREAFATTFDVRYVVLGSSDDAASANDARSECANLLVSWQEFVRTRLPTQRQE